MKINKRILTPIVALILSVILFGYQIPNINAEVLPTTVEFTIAPNGDMIDGEMPVTFQPVGEQPSIELIASNLENITNASLNIDDYQGENTYTETLSFPLAVNDFITFDGADSSIGVKIALDGSGFLYHYAPIGEGAYITLTFDITLNNVSNYVNITYILSNTVIAKYPGGATINMIEGSNNAEALGLDPSIFNVTNKSTPYNAIGLNTAGNIRLYANREDGNGNTLEISTLGGQIITSIKITYLAGSNTVEGETSGLITFGNDEGIVLQLADIRNTTKEYTGLNVESFTIKNTTTGSKNGQIWISEIQITFIETFDVRKQKKDDIPNLPITEPAKYGFTFKGWYLDSEYTTPLNLDDRFEIDSYVYGFFQEKAKITIKFYDGDLVISEAIQYESEAVLKPPNPVKAGHVFMGWYLDSEFTTKLENDATFESDVNIYAKFIAEAGGAVIPTEENNKTLYLVGAALLLIVFIAISSTKGKPTKKKGK